MCTTIIRRAGPITLRETRSLSGVLSWTLYSEGAYRKMKHKGLIIATGSLAACCLAVILVLFLPAENVAPFVYGTANGEIEWKRIETTWVLRKYEFTGLSSEVRDWVTRYHGEAPGQQVFYTLSTGAFRIPRASSRSLRESISQNVKHSSTELRMESSMVCMRRSSPKYSRTTTQE